jgi:hypothetical protein
MSVSHLKEKWNIFQNRALKKMLGPKREGNRKWSKLYNEELHNLSSSLDTIRQMTCVTTMKDMRNSWKI